MDSITQLTLGSIVGRSLSKKKGLIPLVAGGIAGTLPDLDVLLSPFTSDVTSMIQHRSLTHSLLLCFPVAWLISYFLRNWKLEQKEWFRIFFYGFVTHILLDLCTSFGTKIFWPISSYPFSLSTIFIIDPLYTIPLLVAFFYYVFRKKSEPVKLGFAYVILFISTSYILLGGAFKLWADSKFRSSLEQEGIKIELLGVQAAPLSIFQWRAFGISKNDGYINGWFSVFNPSRKIEWQIVPRLKEEAEVKELLKSNYDFSRLEKFSKGFYQIIKDNDYYYFNDMRFNGFLNFIIGNRKPFDKIEAFEEFKMDRAARYKKDTSEMFRLWWERF